MSEITVKCNAKINLSLDVLRKRDDGYHDVEMIMQEIPLYDDITVKLGSRMPSAVIKLTCNNSAVPLDFANIAYKAAELFMKSYGEFYEVDIHIEKRIPVGAGMAGGSTDAAGVFKAMNELFENPFTTVELMKMGKTLGADVPFCIMGGCALSEGIGDVLSPLSKLSGVCYLIAKPEFSVSTPWVYKNFNLSVVKKHPVTKEVIKAVEENDLERLAYYTGNVLETVTAKEFPVIEKYKEKMMEYGAVYSLMSGSGPTVFGIFDNFDFAQKAFEEFKELTNEAYLVQE